MRHHARFSALVLVAFVFAISADFNPAQAQVPTPTPVQPGQVIISELRLRGPAGVEDEYIEIYNNTDSDITVQALDDTDGWAVFLSTGQLTGPVFTLPNGTVIRARGHLLGANADGYSLCNYPSGNSGLDIGGATAPAVPTSPCLTNGIGGTFTHTTPDRTWGFDVPDGAGIALFASTNHMNSAAKLDAVGFTGSPASYREGGGIPTVVGLSAEHAYYRDLRNGTPRDTGDNAADFLLVGTAPGLQITRLGAPGPENSNSPVVNNSTINPSLLDPAVSSTSPPNRERNATAETNADLGTMLIRRRITNNTGLPISRLRFRVVTITTLGTPASECPAPSCADLRALTSEDEPAVVTSGGTVLVRGVRLEEPPEQPAGGAYNSSLSADSVSLLSLLMPGESINVVFKLGVMRDGPFRFFMNIEAQNAVPHTRFDGPASGVGAGGGTNFDKRKLIMDTVRSAPAANPAPAGPAAPSAAPRTIYVPLIINTTPRTSKPARAADEEEDEEGEDKEEDKEKKSEEDAQPAPQTPEASAPEAPADAAQPAPAGKGREASRKRPADAKAAGRGEQ
jgi:hypothetical protein